MHLAEELIVCGATFGLIALLPLFYWWKATQQQWISIFGIDLAKDWHKPNKAYIHHARSQARSDVIRVFQQDGIRSFCLLPLDDLNHKLTSMEDVMEDVVRPVWTPWLCVLVILEMFQFMAVPFACQVHWDTRSTWRFVPEAIGIFLPNPADHRIYDLTTWVILAPLYATAFGVFWMVMLGSSMRFLPFLNNKDTQEFVGDIFVRMMLIGREIFISSKEAFFNFGSLFILTGIIRSLYDHEGQLEFYWPSSLVVLALFYGLLLWSDEVTNSVVWMHRVVQFFFLDRAPHLYEKLPKNDHFYYQRLIGTSNNKDMRNLHLHLTTHQRPTFSSRWIFISVSAKLIIAVLFVLAHFEEFWAWMLLSISTVLFLALLRESIRNGPCSFQWINVLRNIGLISALWGNLCGFLAQGFHEHPHLTYEFTPTAVFVAGLGVILGGAPFCVYVSKRLFTCSPIRLHPHKLQVIHSYFKLVALGRIDAFKHPPSGSKCETPRTDLDRLLRNNKFEQLATREQDSASKKLMVNHELWVAWIKKNAQLVKISHCELSMQDKIIVCSKKSLAHCIPVSDESADLYSIRKIKEWLSEAEMVIDPEQDIELGLHVPYDEYFSFADGAPIFTGDPGGRVFSEKSLQKINVAPAPRRASRSAFGSHGGSEATQTSVCSPTSVSLHLVISSNGRRIERSWGSSRSFQQPCRPEQGERRPNRICSMPETLSQSSYSETSSSDGSSNAAK